MSGALDQLLAEQAALPTPAAVPAAEAECYRRAQMLVTGVISAEGVERLRSMVVALEQECAAMTEALEEMTHEFVPDAEYGTQWCVGDEYGECGLAAGQAVHRTPARIRAEAADG